MEKPSEAYEIKQLLEKQIEQQERMIKEQRTGVMLEGFVAIASVIGFILLWRFVFRS